MGRSPKGMRLGGECKGMTDKEKEGLRGRGRSADVRGQSAIIIGLDRVSKSSTASGFEMCSSQMHQ